MVLEETIGGLEKYTTDHPRDVEALFRLGLLYEKEGNLEKAIGCFKDCLYVAPSCTKARFELGINYSRKKAFDFAMGEWEQVLDSDGDYEFQAMKVHHKGAVIEAIKGWEEYERSTRESAYSLFTLAFAFYTLRQLDRAVMLATKALAIDDRLDRAYYLLGLACKDKGDHEGALKAFNQELALRPGNPNVYYHMGVTYQNRGMTQKAVEAFQKAIHIKLRYIKAFYRLGVVYSLQGLHTQAEQELKRALDYRPDFAQAHLALGNVFFSLYNMDDAVGEYEEALRCDPELKEAFIRLGELKKAQGKMEDALTCFESASSLAPRDADVLYHLGFIHLHLRRYEAAIEVLKKAQELRPGDATIHYSLGEALSAEGRSDDAIDAYRKTIALNPQDTKAARALGKALFTKGDFESARQEFEKVCALDPHDVLSRYCLGLSLLHSGKNDGALKIYEKLAADEPGNFYRQLSMGAACNWSGDYQRGLGYFDRAQELLIREELKPDPWGTLKLMASAGLYAASCAPAKKEEKQLPEPPAQSVQPEQGGRGERTLTDALLEALKLRSRYTWHHSLRVAMIAKLLALHIRSLEPELVDDEVAAAIETGALLHDIGCLGIPDSALTPPGSLTDEEAVVMRNHPLLGAALLEKISFPAEVVSLVRSHEERFDGRGYPDGLNHEAIPFGAMIIGIADFYDRLVNPPGGQGAAGPEKAMDVLQQEEDRAFDAGIIQAFMEIVPGLGEALAALEK